MNNLLFCVFGVCLLTCGVLGQRVAPGVNPQKYDYDYGKRNQQQYQPQQQQQHPQYQQPNQRQYQRSPPQINPNLYEQVPEVPVHPNVQYQQQQQQQQQPPQQPQYQQQQPPQQPQYQQQQAPQQQPQVPQRPQVPQQPQAGGHGHGHGHGSPQPSNVLNAANVHQEKDHISEHMEVPIDTSKMTDEELQFHYFKMHDSDKNGKLDGCELTKSMIHWHENDGPEANTGKKTYNDEELEHTVDEVLRLMDKNRDGFIDYSEYKMSEAEMENSGVKSP